MNPRLRRVSVQSLRIRIPRETIHDCPARAAGPVDLKTKVVVRACDGVVVLMDDKVCAIGAVEVGTVERGIV